jgi:hypothetical protein
MKRFPIGTIVVPKSDCRELDNNYLLKPQRYLVKGYKKLYDEYCPKISLLDYQDVELGIEYLVPNDKIYKI